MPTSLRDADPRDDVTATRPRRERVSGTRISVAPPTPHEPPAPSVPVERMLAVFARALTRSGEASTDSAIAAAHYEALTEVLPGRMVAVRVVNAGTRAVEIAFSNMPFAGGADLVLRLQAEARRPVFNGAASGFDVAVEAQGELLGAVTVEHPAQGPVGAFTEAVVARDLGLATQVARQLSALLAVGRQRRAAAAEPQRRMIPLTPVAPVGFGNELRALFDGSREVIALLDRAGTIRAGNSAMAEMLACPPERLAGRSFTEIVEPGDRRRLGGSFWTALRGQASQLDVSITQSAGEETRLMALSFSPVRDASGMVLGAMVIGRDVTDQRLREEQFARADKLATVGRLAASIVHEINNPLTAILAYSDQLARRSSPNVDPRDLTRASRITEAAERIRSLVRRLLAYTPSNTEQPAPLSLQEVVSQAGQFCEHVLRERSVTLDVCASPDTPAVFGLRAELAQVFVNLVTNACHACPPKTGRIEAFVGSPEPGLVRVVIRDNGHGIAQKDLSRIFEPFFTTKGNGQGTGLGLSIVRSILEQHRAALAVESVVGAGTSFTIDFPAHSA
ncbi:MAG: ATP-binding protein [Polyangiales bacterium]